MAAHPRALGHCFNPISVFWCFDAAGGQTATVVEVHNTYGDRHAYLVHPDERGRATTEKAMYVSPFHGTDGTYELAVPVPGDRLHVAVSLHTDDGAVFSASLTGTRTPGGTTRRAARLRPSSRHCAPPPPPCAARSSSAPTASGCGSAACRSDRDRSTTRKASDA